MIQGSASEAVVTVMVAARDKYLNETTSHLEGEEKEDAIAHKRSRLVALGSDQAHSSTQKAALIAGVRYRSVPTTKDNDFSLTGEALLKTIEECKAKGLEPFFLFHHLHHLRRLPSTLHRLCSRLLVCRRRTRRLTPSLTPPSPCPPQPHSIQATSEAVT